MGVSDDNAAETRKRAFFFVMIIFLKNLKIFSLGNTMEIEEIEKNEKIEYNYICEHCHYKCLYNCDWVKHLSTRKHKVSVNGNQMEIEEIQKLDKTFFCNCGKMFQSNSGLWKHRKKCDCKEEEKQSICLENNDNELTDREIIKALLKIVQNGNNINNNINNINNNSYNTTNIENKTFNLNFFLNETCKDAMNISEFVSSIKVTLSDLENTGKQGYVEGISNIIVKHLNNLEQHFRPLHCSDFKREVFYIKENNEWLKENQEKPILTKAIKVIANENIKQIKQWREKYPDCTDSDSKKNNMYLKIVSNSMNGLTEEESNRNIDKIISNVAREVVIDKQAYK